MEELNLFPLSGLLKAGPIIVVGLGFLLFIIELNKVLGYSFFLRYIRRIWFLVPLSTQGVLRCLNGFGKLGRVVDQG